MHTPAALSRRIEESQNVSYKITRGQPNLHSTVNVLLLYTGLNCSARLYSVRHEVNILVRVDLKTFDFSSRAASVGQCHFRTVYTTVSPFTCIGQVQQPACSLPLLIFEPLRSRAFLGFTFTYTLYFPVY
jgi:hypothetical protein